MRKRSVNGHAPLLWHERSGQRTQQRRLPRSVRADDRDQFVRAQRQLDVAQHNTAVVPEHEPTRVDHATRRRRNAMKRNTGTPISDNSTPIGNSMGGTAERASVSARTTIAAPAGMLAGTVQRVSEPQIARTRCGTMSPTNPITPLTLTAAATSNDDAISVSQRVRERSTPSATARASPKRIALSAGTTAAANAKPSAAYAPAQPRSRQPCPTSEPPSHDKMLSDTLALGESMMTSVVIPANSDVTAIPAKIKRSGDTPRPRRASAATPIVVASAAANASPA